MSGGRTNLWYTDLTYPEMRGTEPMAVTTIPYTLPGVGFIMMQSAVDFALAQMYHPDNAAPAVIPRLKQFPFPSHKADGFLGAVVFLVPFILLLTFMCVRTKTLTWALSWLGVAHVSPLSLRSIDCIPRKVCVGERRCISMCTNCIPALCTSSSTMMRKFAKTQKWLPGTRHSLLQGS